MSMLTRILAGMRSASAHQVNPPAVKLYVTDDDGRVLADVANAGRDDYRLCVTLPSGPVMVDLYGHYQRFIDRGGKIAYRGTDAACHTYVKFGECMQDKRALHILIQPFKGLEIT